jgi:hypothetical protein
MGVYRALMGSIYGADMGEIRRRSGITQVYVRYNSAITPGVPGLESEVYEGKIRTLTMSV